MLGRADAPLTPPDHFTQIGPTKAKSSAINKLKSLGYDITITPATAA